VAAVDDLIVYDFALTNFEHRFSGAPVPEPGTALLSWGGLSLVAGAARRR
jgi:uncharacterized protein (TIGR03382 family)